MDRINVRRAGALAIAAVVCVGSGLVTAGPAAAVHRVAAGTYTATFPATSASSTLVVTNATGSTLSGTFAFSAFGDYGTWIVQGTSVAFLVSTSSVGHAGAVLLGKLTSTGISPGTIGRVGVGEQPWTATRTAGGPTSAIDASFSRPASGPLAAAKVPGVYHAVFNTTVADTLTVTNDTVSKKEGSFTLTSLGDVGAWAMLGKKIVLGVTSGEDAGIVLIGTISATAVGSAASPGAYYEPGSGIRPWYATKTA